MLMINRKKVTGAKFGSGNILKIYTGRDLRADFTKKPQPDEPSEYEDYKNEYFTVENVGLTDMMLSEIFYTNLLNYCEVSIDGGQWMKPSGIALNKGNKARVRGRVLLLSGILNQVPVARCKLKIYGNPGSLQDWDDFADGNANNKYLSQAFKDTHDLVDAENLYIPEHYSLLTNTFSGCINLEKAPKRVKTTLSSTNGMASMFEGCTKLKESPIIDVDTEEGTSVSFSSMFKDCTSLSKITCLNENTDPEIYRNWVSNVAPTGTFVKKAGTSWTVGNNGIPQGWLVEEYDDYEEYKNEYFTVTNVGDTTFTPMDILDNYEGSTVNGTWSRNLQFSLNNGDWTPSMDIQVGPGDSIRIKGEHVPDKYRNVTILTEGVGFEIKISGNPNSIFGGDNFVNFDQGGVEFGCRMFYSAKSLVDAENLYIPENFFCSEGCRTMFSYCTNLRKAPRKLVGTFKDAGDNAFLSMFEGCNALKETPLIKFDGPFGKSSFERMFYLARGLEKVTCLNDNGNKDYYANWLYLVPSTGTFVKRKDVDWSSGSSGIPQGWTVEEID